MEFWHNADQDKYDNVEQWALSLDDMQLQQAFEFYYECADILEVVREELLMRERTLKLTDPGTYYGYGKGA